MLLNEFYLLKRFAQEKTWHAPVCIVREMKAQSACSFKAAKLLISGFGVK